MLLKDTGGVDFEQPPIGTQVARCIKLIDIGTQKGEYQGSTIFKRQVIIAWELPNALITKGEYTGKPFGVSKFYTASLSEKANLRKDLANWRGRDFSEQELKGFEAKNILGAPCMLSLVSNDKGKVRVGAVMACPKGMDVPKAVNELVYFSLEPDQFTHESFEKLSDGYKKMILLSPEYQELINPSHYDQPHADVDTDDIGMDAPW